MRGEECVSIHHITEKNVQGNSIQDGQRHDMAKKQRSQEKNQWIKKFYYFVNGKKENLINLGQTKQ